MSHEQIRDCFHQTIKTQHEDIAGESNSGQSTPSQVPDDFQIAFSLFSYLSTDKLIKAVKKFLQEDVFELPQAPFFDLTLYAVEFWPAHYRKAETRALLLRQVPAAPGEARFCPSLVSTQRSNQQDKFTNRSLRRRPSTARSPAWSFTACGTAWLHECDQGVCA